MTGDRRAIQEIWKLLEQAMEDVAVVLPAWVHMRIADRFMELAEEAGISFLPPREIDDEALYRMITGEDDTDSAQ